MPNLSQVVGIAKLLFPNKADMIDQAMGMAKQFSPSKDGVAQLMAQYGKSREDIRGAVKMLDNPLVKNTLGRIPGLENALRRTATELETVSPMPTQPSAPVSPAPPMAAPTSTSSASFAARLAALK